MRTGATTVAPGRRGAVLLAFVVSRDVVAGGAGEIEDGAGGGLDAFIDLDDDEYVFENPTALRGLTREGVVWALTSFEHANWLPLARLTHLLDVSLFGLDARGHHLTNVVIHAAAAALLFLALARLTGAPGRSALAAALFGVHPLHVESVAWISERKDVLSALFFALVLLAWERYARRGGRARHLLVVVLLALGLMAKPMLVTVPALLLLLDLWPLGRRRAPNAVPWRRLLLEKVPLLALAVASAAVTFLAQRAGGAVQTTERFPLGDRVGNAFVAAATYLAKTFWPSPLAVYYPHPGAHPLWKVAAGALVLAALGALAWRERRRRP